MPKRTFETASSKGAGLQGRKKIKVEERIASSNCLGLAMTGYRT
jgi:hypothetical protein